MALSANSIARNRRLLPKRSHHRNNLSNSSSSTSRLSNSIRTLLTHLDQDFIAVPMDLVVDSHLTDTRLRLRMDTTSVDLPHPLAMVLHRLRATLVLVVLLGPLPPSTTSSSSSSSNRHRKKTSSRARSNQPKMTSQLRPDLPSLLPKRPMHLVLRSLVSPRRLRKSLLFKPPQTVL